MIKTIASILIFFVMLPVNGNNINGDSVVVENKKGKISKILKDIQIPNLTKLKVLGELNEEDLLYLSACTSLETLDLEDAIYSTKELGRNQKFNGYITCKLRVQEKMSLLKLFKTAYFKKEMVPFIADLDVMDVGNNIDIFISTNTKPQIISRDKRRIVINIYGDLQSYTPLQKRKYHGFKFETHVDILTVPSEKILSMCYADYDYNILCIQDTKQINIKRWEPCYGKYYLENASSIKEFAIDNNNDISSLTMHYLKIVPKGFGFQLPNLQELSLPVAEEIYDVGSHSLKRITFSPTIKYIDQWAFGQADNLKEIEFTSNTPPSWYTPPVYMQNRTIIVPKGSLRAYLNAFCVLETNKKDEYNHRFKIREKGANPTATIICDMPGHFDSFLTEEVINNTDYLIVQGSLYDTEKLLVNKIKWLKDVDWSGAKIIKSDETKAKEKRLAEEKAQWEKDRPRREAEQRKLNERRNRVGVGSVSEGYNMGYLDGYRGQNNIFSYELSENPLYSNAFLDGYRRGFTAGQDAKMKDELLRLRNM